MGIFSRKKQQVAPTASSISTPPRDIPRLNPDFYERALNQAAKPVTSSNVAAVAGLTASNLTLNAHRWLDVLGESDARRRWDSQFADFGHDAARATAAPDDMIDFLWHVSPRLHPGLRDFVNSMQGTIVSSSQKFGPQLPADMWSAS